MFSFNYGTNEQPDKEKTDEPVNSGIRRITTNKTKVPYNVM